MQIPIHPDDQHKTTFTCPYGTFAYKRMPFGLCNAPTSIQHCMMAVFSEFIEEIVELFMDDFSVDGKTFVDCLTNLDKVLTRCAEVDLVLNLEKCHFMVKQGVGGDSKSSLSYTKNKKSVFSCPSPFAKGPAAKPQEPLIPFPTFRTRLSTSTLRRQRSCKISSEQSKALGSWPG
jgi:hypothetical protein